MAIRGTARGSWINSSIGMTEVMKTRLFSLLFLAGLASLPLSAAPVNLAPAGTATGIDAAYGSTFPRGIDGNRNGAFGAGSVWHSTDPGVSNAWYQVDLGGTYYLDRVQIFPRTDASQHTVVNFRLSVLDAADAVVWQGDFLPSTAADRAWGSAAMRGVQGRKVRIDRLNNNAPKFLTLAEFEVWGQSTPIATNLAQGKPATATPADFGTTIANGNDGNIDGDYAHAGTPIYHSTASAIGNFWQVDLESTNELGYILIFNRVDSATTSNVRLSVLDGDQAPVYAATVNISRAVQVLNANQFGIAHVLPTNVVGRYVRMETLENEFLAFGELQVFPANLDLVPPLVSGVSFSSSTQLLATVGFTEPVDPATATNAANYLWTGGPSVTSAVLLPGASAVRLGLSGLLPNASFALSVSGVKDVAGNTMVATNLAGTVPFYEINWARGGVATQSSTGYGGLPGLAIDGTTYGGFGAGSVTHNQPPEDGGWWEVDLGAEKPIGRISWWWRTDGGTEGRQDNFTWRVLDASRNPVFSETYSGRPPAPSYPHTFMVPLSGRFVRFEAPVPRIGDGSFSLAEVEVIMPYEGVSITVTQAPADQVATVNATASFGPVGAILTGVPQSGLALQWLSNNVPIPGATTPTYTTPRLALENNGDHYAAVFYIAGLASTSAVATLTVIADQVPPEVLAVTPLVDPVDGLPKLLVRYSELMDAAMAGEIWNYTLLNGLTLESVQAGADGRSALLTVSGLESLWGYYELQIQDVTDLSLNVLAPTNFSGRFAASGVNLALASLGCVATQSSTNYGGLPELAIDGNTNGAFAAGSVTHNLEPEIGGWWEVDLGSRQALGQVRLWWRNPECPDCGDRQNDFHLKVLDAFRQVVWTTNYPGHPPLPYATLDLPLGMAGRFVRFEAPVPPVGNGSFSLAEVQVFQGFLAAPYLRSIGPVTGGIEFSFDGTPDHSYSVERALVISGPWTNLTTGVVASEGLMSFTDTNAPAGGAFYRVVYP